MERASLIQVSAHHWCLSSSSAKHFRIAPVELFTQKPWCTRGFLQQLKFKHVLKCLVEQDSLFFPNVYVHFPGNTVIYFASFIIVNTSAELWRLRCSVKKILSNYLENAGLFHRMDQQPSGIHQFSVFKDRHNVSNLWFNHLLLFMMPQR